MNPTIDPKKQAFDQATVAAQNAAKVTGGTFADDGVQTPLGKTIGSYTPPTKTAPTPTNQAPEYLPRAKVKADGTRVVAGEQNGPQSQDQIQRDLMKTARTQIKGLNNYYQQQLDEQMNYNQDRSREVGSVNTLTGLAGSSEANRITTGQDTKNKKALDMIQAEQQMAIQGVLDGVSKAAMEEARAQRTEYRAQTEADEKQRVARLEEAQQNATILASSGVTAEGYAKTDPEGYKYLAEKVGGEQVLKSMFTLNRPQESILDKRIEGGKYIISYQNPIDGKVRIETVDLGLPPNYTKTLDAGNRILAIPDNWSGDPSELVTINKGLTPGQSQSASNPGSIPGSNTAYTSDLDALIGATESVIPSKFGQETFRKNIGRSRSEADKISLIASVVLGKADSTTKTDFANQAVGIKQLDAAIAELDKGVQTGALQAGAQYTYNIFGKDYDPKLASINQKIISAIQPYRNSITGAAWGDQEDGEYQQLFGSTKYAPEELKQRLTGMRDILASKSATALSTYVNPLGTYGNQFETGNLAPQGGIRAQVDAAGFDYEAGYSGSRQGGSTGTSLVSPDGTQEVNIADLTPEQIEEARNAGWQ